MKKFLLPFAAILMAATAVAAPLKVKKSPVLPTIENSRFSAATQIEVAPAMAKAPSRAGETPSMDYTLAGAPYTALALKFSNAQGQQIDPSGIPFAMAFEINAQAATQLAGNKITAISFYTGLNQATNKNDILSGNVFLSNDLSKDFVYTEAYTCGTKAAAKVTVPLTTPYVIEAGKPVFVGFNFKIANANDLYMVVDGIQHDTDEGGWFANQTQDADGNLVWDWTNMAEIGRAAYGFFTISATLEGESLPVDGAVLFGSQMPVTVESGKPFEFLVGVTNQASNEVSNVDVRYTIGSQTPVTVNVPLEAPIKFNEQSVALISGAVADAPAVNLPVKIEVVGVNGNPNTNTTAAVTVNDLLTALAPGANFKRNVLIEEATSIGCGWCPIGAVMMEMLRKTFTDNSVARIAVHNNYGGTTDPMYTLMYSKFFSTYVTSYPSAFINRTTEIYPGSHDDIVAEVEYLKSYPAVADIDFTTAYDESTKKIKFNTNTTFALDIPNASSIYKLFFIISEDQVGPYNQLNYCSGQKPDAAYGDWTSKGQSVSMLFDDVARNIGTVSGVVGSVPTSVENGKAVEYSYDLSASKVTNFDNAYVTVGLLNTVSGTVDQVAFKSFKEAASGIADVVASADVAVSVAGRTVSVAGAAAQVYNLAGQLAAVIADGASAELPSGLYIVKAGSTVKKIAL